MYSGVEMVTQNRMTREPVSFRDTNQSVCTVAGEAIWGGGAGRAETGPAEVAAALGAGLWVAVRCLHCVCLKCSIKTKLIK